MQNKPIDLHKGHPKKIIKGPFGPHQAKMICRKCNGAFVRWISKKNLAGRNPWQ